MKIYCKKVTVTIATSLEKVASRPEGYDEQPFAFISIRMPSLFQEGRVEWVRFRLPLLTEDGLKKLADILPKHINAQSIWLYAGFDQVKVYGPIESVDVENGKIVVAQSRYSPWDLHTQIPSCEWRGVHFTDGQVMNLVEVDDGFDITEYKSDMDYVSVKLNEEEDPLVQSRLLKGKDVEGTFQYGPYTFKDTARMSEYQALLKAQEKTLAA